MKKMFMILAAVLLTASVFAQAPQKMSYQAVIRNSSNQLVTNYAVRMQVSILQGVTSVYVETHVANTNANGLMSIEIGTGTVISGNFATINWANGTYFIKTETDPAGGTNYTITGTSQLLSVPYALHSKTAETLTGGFTETDPIFGASPAKGITSTLIGNWNTAYSWGNHASAGYLKSFTEIDPVFGAWNKSTGISITASQVSNFQTSVTNNTAVLANTAKNSYPSADATKLAGIAAGAEVNVKADWNATSGDAQILNKPVIAHSIGESYGGGIVFYVYDGGQHGLIAATADQSTGIQWYNGTYRYTGTTGGDGIGAGEMNTAMIVATQISDNQTGNFAAKICANYAVTVGNVRYGDWYLPSKFELSLLYLQKSVVGGFVSRWYWSSSEGTNNYAFLLDFSNGFVYSEYKNNTWYVRAIRAF